MLEKIQLINKILALIIFTMATYNYHKKDKDISTYDAMIVILLLIL